MKEKPVVQNAQEAYYWKLQEEIAKRYKHFDLDSVRVAFAVIFTFNIMEALVSKRLQEAGLTVPGFNSLVLLHFGKQEGYSLTELSKFLVSSRANITGVIDSLVKNGYVTREDHPNDRRVIVAKITKAGRDFVEGYFPGHSKLMMSFSTSLSLQEKRQLIQLLGKMRLGILERAAQEKGAQS